MALRELNASNGMPSADLRRIILEGGHISPIDARFYSLKGILKEREGDRQAASLLFDRALTLLPTEFQALAHKLAYDIEAGNLSTAVDRIEIIGRRWPKHWALVEPMLPPFFADEDAFDALVRRFGREADLRTRLVGSLAREPDTAPLAYHVLLRWHHQGLPRLEPLINDVTARLIHAGRYADAFLLFRLTRSGEAEREAGYVYNGEFRLPPSGSPFDWRLKSQAGVAFKFVELSAGLDENGREVTGGASEADQHELVIRFLDNPIQFRNVSQFTRLAPGEYALSLSYGARDLAAPKPLKFAIGCVGGRSALATVELQSGSVERRRESVEFAVPATCGLQELFIYNDPMPMSWRNRYSGTLRIGKVAISRTGADQ